jgi:hypothetical protein
MTRFLPSLRGWVAFLLAFFASMFLPATFPARNGHTGKFFGPVSTETWVIGAVTLAACIVASVFAFRGSRPDKVAASLASVFIILLIVMYAKAVA